MLRKTLIPNLSQDFGHITAAQRSEPVTHGFCAGDPLERLKLCTLIIGEHLPEKTRQMWMSLGFRVCWFGAYAFSGLVDVCSRHNCQTEGERMIVPEEDPTPADFPVCERLTNLGIWQFWFSTDSCTIPEQTNESSIVGWVSHGFRKFNVLRFEFGFPMCIAEGALAYVAKCSEKNKTQWF